MKDAEHPVHVKSAASSANNVQASQTSEHEVLPNPQGIGMAVAFDWGLAVQIAVTPLLMQNLGSIALSNR